MWLAACCAQWFLGGHTLSLHQTGTLAAPSPAIRQHQCPVGTLEMEPAAQKPWGAPVSAV